MRRHRNQRLAPAMAALAACWGITAPAIARPCTDVVVTDGGGTGSLDFIDCDVGLGGDHTILIEAEGSNTGFVVLV